MHDHEERDDRADGDGQTGEAFEEEGVREEDQVDELRQRRFNEGEARARTVMNSVADGILTFDEDGLKREKGDAVRCFFEMSGG